MATSIAAPSGRPRRYDLDWLRVIALGFLIVYHVLCLYDSSGWMLKSVFAGVWADGIVHLLTPWRMVLVFVVSGAACRFLLEKFDLSGFLRNRALRLLAPFVLGVAFLAPPQAYIHLRAGGRIDVSFLDYWATDFWSSRVIHGIYFPDFAHLWFLPYLFIYGAAAALAWSWRPRFMERLTRLFDRMPIALLLAAAAASLAVNELIVEPRSHRTMAFFWDWSGHSRFAPAFLFGLLAAHADQFWRKLEAARWWIWGVTLALACITFGEWAITQDATEQPWLRALLGAAAVFAFLAFGFRFLNKPSATLSYWNDAVLPIYVLHQTVLVVLAATTGAIHWPVAIGFPLLFLATLGVSEGLYHFAIRRSRWLRRAFGQSAEPRTPEHAPARQPAT